MTVGQAFSPYSENRIVIPPACYPKGSFCLLNASKYHSPLGHCPDRAWIFRIDGLPLRRMLFALRRDDRGTWARRIPKYNRVPGEICEEMLV